MTRQIVFDTETTGTSVFDDRVVEIACVELKDLIPTGRTFQRYINPKRDIPAEVVAVHGLTAEFLKDFPVFEHTDIVDAFLEFIGDDGILVAHNAEFDRGFLNAEFSRMGKPPFQKDRFIDTLDMARKMFPGAPASLNALCKRFSVSLETRDKHGALIDCHLLAAVYLELSGGREQKLALFDDRMASAEDARAAVRKPRPKKLPSLITPEEAAAHAAFIAEMGDKAIWLKTQTEAAK